MLKTLFDPRGTIDNKGYWRACEILFGLYIVGFLVWICIAKIFDIRAVTLIIGAVFFIYSYICVYGKRLASVGRSRFWLLAIFPAYYALNFLVGIPLHGFVFSSMGYDNVLVNTMISETSATGLRVASGLLYVFILNSPMLPPILICSLAVGLITSRGRPTSGMVAI